MKKISNSEILSALVFLPPGKTHLLQRIRIFTKLFLNFAGKILGIFL